MVKTETHCIISGEKFSPLRAEKTLGNVFVKTSEPGEIAEFLPTGPESIPHGRAVMEFEEPEEISDPLSSEQLDLLSRCVRESIKSGATLIDIDITVRYCGQCNWEMSAEFLDTLAAIGATVTFTCLKDDSLEALDREVHADVKMLSDLLGVTEVDFTEKILPTMKRDFAHALAEIGSPADFDIILWGQGLDAKILVSDNFKTGIVPTGIRLKKYSLIE
jgi:hypothetical protein